jgi:hypothetical protein
MELGYKSSLHAAPKWNGTVLQHQQQDLRQTSLMLQACNFENLQNN